MSSPLLILLSYSTRGPVLFTSETVTLVVAGSAASTASADKPLKILDLEYKLELSVFVFSRA
jgi:hypothetical protein